MLSDLTGRMEIIMIRTLTMTEEQFQAVMEIIDGNWDIYATMKGDDCVDPDDIRTMVNENFPELVEHTDEWFTKYEELCEAEVDRVNNIGLSAKYVLNEMIEMSEEKIDQEDTDAERLYFKYRDSIDRDWSTIGCWMLEAVPETMSNIEEEILFKEYGVTFDLIDELESDEPEDLPYEESWDYKRMIVSSAVEYMLKGAIRG